jgi:hypothetical protein
VIHDADRLGFYLDHDIILPNPRGRAGAMLNVEPLLINTKGSWWDRPTAKVREMRNLYLASDYVRTFTDLATMEAANEAARRAVNAILDDSGSDEQRLKLVPLKLPGDQMFKLARAFDKVRYRLRHDTPPAHPIYMSPGGEFHRNPLFGLERAHELNPVSVALHARDDGLDHGEPELPGPDVGKGRRPAQR